MQLYKRPNRKGGFVWVIRWTEGRKQRQKTLIGIQREDLARRALAEMEHQRERGAAGLPTDPNFTVRQALDDYNDHRAGMITESRTKLHRSRADQICQVMDGNRAAGKLDAGSVAKLRLHLQARKRSPNTINEYQRLLSAAINYAVERGIIARNPLAAIGKVSDPRAPKWRFLEQEEIETLLNLLRDGYKVEKTSRSGNVYTARQRAPRGMYELVVFLLNTGARLGEALAVQWGDVDLRRSHVRLVTTKRASGGRPAVPRFVPINAALRELLDGLAEKKPRPTDKVLTIGRNNVRRKFISVCDHAGLGHVRLHDLRHTFCSHLAMAGVPLPTIQSLAGHTAISTTMRYAHLAPGAAQAGVDTLNFGATSKGAKVVELAG